MERIHGGVSFFVFTSIIGLYKGNFIDKNKVSNALILILGSTISPP